MREENNFMSLSLHTIKSARGSRTKKVRIGRGGKSGTYSGKGQKGQRARSGGRHNLKRLGMRQLMEQTPKLRGFKSPYKKAEIVNLKDLNKKFKDGESVTPEILLKKRMVSKIKNGVKILGNGEIKIKLNISGCTTSASVKEAIVKASGTIKE
jgi:large subunit ribosomal protein L15